MTKSMQDFITLDDKNRRLICKGEWNLNQIVELKKAWQALSWPRSGALTIDGGGITQLDVAGAWLLNSSVKKLQEQGLKVELVDFSEPHQTLLSLIEKEFQLEKDVPEPQHMSWFARVGKMTVNQVIEGRNYLAFVGHLTMESLRLLAHPAHLRWRAFASVIESSGYQALPIIALLSFMIGVVIAYQMGIQLRNYGANIFIVDFLGLAVLREFGPLLTAIMIAGRTGSAFTAQLGIMKINQEVDALNTMGVTPAELLLLPRVIGLFVALPLLTIWADIFGVLGGMVMANNMLGISWYDFLHRFEQQIPLRTLIIGLGKAPVFALLIGSIGCFQGMQVQGSADSVGKKTTRSVVLAIFFIIVVDAIFSVILSKFHL